MRDIASESQNEISLKSPSESGVSEEKDFDSKLVIGGTELTSNCRAETEGNDDKDSRDCQAKSDWFIINGNVKSQHLSRYQSDKTHPRSDILTTGTPRFPLGIQSLPIYLNSEHEFTWKSEAYYWDIDEDKRELNLMLNGNCRWTNGYQVDVKRYREELNWKSYANFNDDQLACEYQTNDKKDEKELNLFDDCVQDKRKTQGLLTDNKQSEDE